MFRELLHEGADPAHTVKLSSGYQSAWSLAQNDPACTWCECSAQFSLPKRSCEETIQLIQSSLNWKAEHEVHWLFPPGFRRGVRHLLALRQANRLSENKLCQQPLSIWMLIIINLPRHWSICHATRRSSRISELSIDKH